jgi:DNA-binding response OmpR family regulator
MLMRILIVEDERGIAEFLERALTSEGFVADSASDGETGEAMALSGDYDLVLLDVMLPRRSGHEILAAIRAQRPEVPVILLTALGESADVVEGLDLGADDYITKPFDLDELMARIRAQLRRPAQRNPTRLESGDIAVDLRTRQVTRAGVSVHLTAREFELLVYLMRHPNQVLTREQILSAVWGYDFDPGTNVLSVYINYLRRKLNVAGNPPSIETVRSVGFKLAVGDA